MTSQSRSPLQYARIAAAQSTASAAGCINRSIYRQKFALSRHSSLHPHQQNIPPANKRVNHPIAVRFLPPIQLITYYTSRFKNFANEAQDTVAAFPYTNNSAQKQCAIYKLQFNKKLTQ